MRSSVIESECRSPARAAAIEWSVPSSRIAVGVESRLPCVGRQRPPRALRQPLVRLRDAAAEDEVAERGPGDEEDDDQDERDRQLAGPADLTRPAGRRLRARAPIAATPVALGLGARRRLLGPADRRHPALSGVRPGRRGRASLRRASTSGGVWYPRRFGAVAGHRGGRRRDEDPRRGRLARRLPRARASSARATTPRRTRCSPSSTRWSRSSTAPSPPWRRSASASRRGSTSAPDGRSSP